MTGSSRSTEISTRIRSDGSHLEGTAQPLLSPVSLADRGDRKAALETRHIGRRCGGRDGADVRARRDLDVGSRAQPQEHRRRGHGRTDQPDHRRVSPRSARGGPHANGFREGGRIHLLAKRRGFPLQLRDVGGARLARLEVRRDRPRLVTGGDGVEPRRGRMAFFRPNHLRPSICGPRPSHTSAPRADRLDLLVHRDPETPTSSAISP